MHRKDFFKKGIGKFLDSAISKSEEIYSSIKNTSDEIVEETNSKKKSSVKMPEFTRSKPIQKNLQYPPGSAKGKEKFESLCTGCGDCVLACPYNVLFSIPVSKSKKEIPFLDPNTKACMLCSDYPCIAVCQTGALKPFKKKYPIFGKAKSLYEFCVNSKLNDRVCSACMDSCPVKDAVEFKKNQPIFQNNCVGCGICVQVCPTFPKAILISS